MTTLTSTFTPSVVCKNFMYNNCQRTNCKFLHDNNICFYFWKFGSCKRGSECNKLHTFVKEKADKELSNNESVENKNDDVKNSSVEKETDNKKIIKKGKQKKNKDKYDKELRKNLKNNKKRNIKNTECFEPMTKPVDIRISYDLGDNRTQVASKITSREVLLVPNLFSDFQSGEIYSRLVSEIESCGIDQNTLLKLWHGDSHLIADDHLGWKSKCPTFGLVINRIREFFKMDIKATRFNWYTDTNQWKPFHHDAAAVKPDKMNTQNFTVGVSFGATREAAFEHAGTKTTISIPQPDGCIYAFSKDTNVMWRHGILQEIPSRQIGRISIIAWGWIDNQIEL